MRIGIIGAGFIGRALARLAVAAGHQVMIANSRDPATLTSTGIALGCQVGTAQQAAEFGDAVVVSVPFTAIGTLPAQALAGKLVLDTCNHYPQRDGADPGLEAMTETTGERLAALLPGALVVKAFNAILQGDVEADARPHGTPGRRALPIAGDDPAARAQAAALIDAWGFDTVDAGAMAESWRFERAMPAYCIALDRAGLAKALSDAVRGHRVADGSWRTARRPATAQHEMTGIASRGAWDVVDSQIHLGLSPTIPEVLAAMDALGIRTLVADEFWDFQHGIARPSVPAGDTRRPLSIVAQQAAQQFPDRFGFVQRVRRDDPMLAGVVALLAQTPGCVGLRIVLSSREERRHFAAGDWDGVLALAVDHGLPVDFLSADLAMLARGAAARFPALALIADHCGWGSSVADWQATLGLADLPGVTLKWAHAGRTFGHFDDAQAAMNLGLVQAVAAFGADRIMWASDITADGSGASWGELLEFPRCHPDLTPDQRAQVLGGTARRIYGLNKDK